jgi:hypothetical protein
MGQASVAAFGVVKAGMEGRLARQLSTGEAERLHAIIARLLKEVVPKAQFEALYANLLAQHYSPAELKDLIAFYRTPLGAKLARLMAVLTTAGAARGEALFGSHEREFGERFAAEFAREFPALGRELERSRPPR